MNKREEIELIDEYEIHPGTPDAPGWHVVRAGRTIGSYGTLAEARRVAWELAAEAAE